MAGTPERPSDDPQRSDKRRRVLELSEFSSMNQVSLFNSVTLRRNEPFVPSSKEQYSIRRLQ